MLFLVSSFWVVPFDELLLDVSSFEPHPVNNNGTIREDENYKSLSNIEDIANIIIIKAECSFKDANNNKKLIYATLPIGIVLNNSDVENNYIKK